MYIPQFEPYSDILPKIAKKVQKQIESGWLSPGAKTEEFESLLCNIFGCKYALATTSGTTALILALKCLDLEPNTKVACPDYTFLACCSAAKFLNLEPVLIDIDDNYTIDVDQVNAQKDIDVAISVHHNCHSPVDESRMRCKHIIQDLAQCVGSSKLTTAMGITSFSIPKIMHTFGGGALLFNNKDFYTKACQLIDHGGTEWRRTKTHVFLGANFKFDEIKAVAGLVQLKKLDQLLSLRDELHYLYKDNGVKLLNKTNNYSSWMCIYEAETTEQADKIISALAEQDIQAVRYYKPIHTNPPYVNNTIINHTYPNSRSAYNTLVYLPSSLNLVKTPVFIKEIAKTIIHECRL